MAVKTKDELNAKQLLFCELYATDREFFGNGTQAYIEAYDVDIRKPSKYKAAMAAASRLLSNVKICNKINELLEAGGLSDQFVDKQLVYLITQHDDKKAKMAAIREYNAMKGRIVARIDHTTKGDKLPAAQVYLPADLPDSEVLGTSTPVENV
jgi:hypothetical protein